MAKTQRDMILKARIEQIIKQFGKEKDIVYKIAAICGITHRTAQEHYKAYMAQKSLKEMGFKETCTHQWSDYFFTPGGLAAECCKCGKTKFAKVK